MKTSQAETQAYKVIHLEKEFEIRFYSSATMAMITTSANTYKNLGSLGFRKLAGYLLGDNVSNQKIGMTLPIHMAIEETKSSIGFVMPSHHTKESLPSPKNSAIQITTTADEYVAAIKFSGFATTKKIKLIAQKLENLLKQKSISYNGTFRLLGYNPPYKLFGRKNEIIVSINWDRE